jgi:CRISPR-associated endonuclease/helicase Cas3
MPDPSSLRFAELFRAATGHPDPFPYQQRLSENPWPDLLRVPTGLGKTAAVGLNWIHRRLRGDPETPRRLVYCLPMRVLVEQTADEFRGWLERLGALGAPGECRRSRISVNLLMGGEDDVRSANWAHHPDESAVLIGTQDMLLSRALMRGYGMSRFQWPVHFALLHNDAMWVFDEVQLMGPALATSAQLEAFRRDTPGGAPSRSLWLSATLRREWLTTVDFRSGVPALESIGIEEDDRAHVPERLGAVKRLHRCTVELDREGAKSRAKAYVEALAAATLDLHQPGTQTLAVLNRVDRAQALARALRKVEGAPEILLVHARFREAERAEQNRALRKDPHSGDRIVVATQAVEAGVDMSSRTLITELAPWSSMVQRFGRCNRYGECEKGADIHWIDILDNADEAAPYDGGQLAEARKVASDLLSAAPGELPEVTGGMAGRGQGQVGMVLRRRDLFELFDTDPDLSGFDLDISPYIRDPGSPQVRVFWRDFADSPGDQPEATREELCPVSMAQIARFLKKSVQGSTRPYWEWDALESRWRRGDRNRRVVPGSTLMLRAATGGYDLDLGFEPDDTSAVPTLAPESNDPPAANDDDPNVRIGRFIELDQHTRHVVDAIGVLTDALDLDLSDRELLQTSARWHDVGKAHPAFQTAMLDWADEDRSGHLWAKSPGRGRPRYRIEDSAGADPRPHFRHELASMLAWLAHADSDVGVDLTAYLIAAHHGKVRLGLRALPTEPVPRTDTLYARGVHDGDQLPPLEVGGLSLPKTDLNLDLMQLGLGPMGPSWTERTQRLLSEMGPFQLAWLEALLRIADWRASAVEEAGP